MKYISKKLSAAQSRLLKQKMKRSQRSTYNAAKLPQFWTRLVLLMVAMVPFAFYVGQALVVQRNVSARFNAAVFTTESWQQYVEQNREVLSQNNLEHCKNTSFCTNLVTQQADQKAVLVAQGIANLADLSCGSKFPYNDAYQGQNAFWSDDIVGNFLCNLPWAISRALGHSLVDAYDLLWKETALIAVAYIILSTMSPAFNLRVLGLTTAFFEYSIFGQLFKTMLGRLSYKNFRSNRL